MLQVLGASLGVMGCSGEMREQRMREDLTDDFCEGEETVGLIQNLQPAEPADALALRTVLYGGTVAEVAGDCEGIPACPDEPPTEREGELDFGSSFYYEPNHLVAYRGDQATIYYTEEELRAFLGTIDTPAEARLLLELAGHEIPCDGESNFKYDATDYVFYTETGHTCGQNLIGHVMRVGADGKVSEEEDGVVERGEKGCVVGRLPHGLCAEAGAGSASELAEYMAENAYLEAASVAAFLDLEQELGAMGAPDVLISWAARAAREERRHAIHCRALTREFGGSVAVPHIERGKKRTPVEIARENAREGLTREAFGALIALHQARFAVHPGVRRVMQEIARDELSHAEFSVALHHYLMSQLDADERDQVEAERQAALVSFGSSMLQDESDELREQFGLPDGATVQRLFRQFFAGSDVFEA